MHKTYYINGSTDEQKFYKSYCNTLTRIKTLAKKLFYKTQFDIHISMIQRKPGTLYVPFNQSINQFSGPAYLWGVAGAAARVGASKHLDPLHSATKHRCSAGMRDQLRSSA